MKRKMFQLLCWFIRLFIWIFSGFGIFQRVLYIPNGWDTLHPFAPYSFGGILRKNFISLYLKKEINDEDLIFAKYGVSRLALTEKISKEMYNLQCKRASYVYKYFLFPFKTEDYNYNK